MIMKYSSVDGKVEIKQVLSFVRHTDQVAFVGKGDDDDHTWESDGTVEVFTDNGVSLGVFEVKGLPDDDICPDCKAARQSGVQ